MLTAWTSHLALASVVLTLIGIVLALCGLGVRRDPSAHYLAARVALAIGLLMLPVQLLAGPWLAQRAPEHTGEMRRIVDRSLESARALSSRTLDRLPPMATEIAVASPPAPRPPRGPNAEDGAPSAFAEAQPPAAIASPRSAVSDFLDANRTRIVVGCALVHLLGVAFFLVTLVRRTAKTRAFLARCSVVDPALLGEPVAQAIARARISRLVVAASAEIESPCCAGILRPMIVVPLGDLDDPSANARVALSVRHELVHLERRDPLVVALQRMLLVAFWFHPVAWWLVRRLDDLREMSCDQRVVEHTGLRRSYARALVDYAATHAPQEPAVSPLLHWIRRRSLLRRRIEMLSQNRVPTSRKSRIAIACATSLGVIAIVAGHVTIAATLPEFGSSEGQLVALCPPKDQPKTPALAPSQTKPPKQKTQPTRTDKKRPRNQSNEADQQKKSNRTDLMQSAPSEEELRNQRIREFIAGRRDSFVSDPAGTRFVRQDLGPQQSPPEIDPDVRKALISTLLHDDHAVTRGAAAAALAPFLSTKEVSDAFMVALRDSRDPQLRVTVLDELLKRETLSTEARDLFVRLFAMDSEEYAKIAFADALAPYAAEPDARDVLIEALLQDENTPMQVNAARALAAQAADSKVRDAMVRVLAESRNEIARMTLITALAPEIAADSDVQDVFITILTCDDNPVARMDAADELAQRANDPKIRRVMLSALERGIAVAEQRIFVNALSPHAHEQDVKHALIALLDDVHNEVVKMGIVQALASVANGRTTIPQYPGLPSETIPGFGEPSALTDPAVVPINDSKY